MLCNNVLQAGYARVDITPDFSVGIAGYEDESKRRSEGVRDPLYLTCIAVTSGEETILIFDADLEGVGDWGVAKICQVVCPVTGIPAEKIFCGATHTHSAPQLYCEMPAEAPYHELVLKAAVAAATEALADRAPAQLRAVCKAVKNMNFVRHYLMEDGTYFGSNFGNRHQRFLNHAAESDPRMLLVQFAREGKQDILLMNWQAHNDSVSFVGKYLLSASYTGEVRKKIEEETEMLFAFFQGASGNQNPSSWIDEENHGCPDHFAYGRKLAGHAIDLLKDLKPVEGTDIVTTRLVYDAQVDHSWDHKLAEAKAVFDTWLDQGKAAGDALARSYGMDNSIHAEIIVERAALEPTVPLVLNAFRIGELAFITSPNELFSTVGIHVRLHGPFENTFIITGNKKYMACMAAFEYGAYEAVTSIYPKGTAEAVADTFVEMLESIN